MKVAYIILAHQYPQQLLRLVQRLEHPAFDCWIHLDDKCRIAEYKEVFEIKNVFAVQTRLGLSWGHFNIVQAMINCLKESFNSIEDYNYFIFLSGMDYPLHSPVIFLNYLKDHAGNEFIGNRPLNESQQNMIRITNYHFNNLSHPFGKITERIANKIFPKRKFPYPFEIRKGPQWMTLSRAAVAYILDFIFRNPTYSAWFKFVLAPDEFFFQTILYNSPFREKMKNHIFHYIDWSEQKKSPKTLTIEDKEKLLASPLFFARKFDEKSDHTILDVLDEKIKWLGVHSNSM
jgi:hypothetical protein